MPDSSRFEPGQPLHVRLYGRPDCSLCNQASVLLNTMHADYDFWVEKINIDDDPAIREKLNEHIPATEEKLRRAFKKALRIEDLDHADVPA
jgi:arsenate reductase-like glutaredoxin family protein